MVRLMTFKIFLEGDDTAYVTLGVEAATVRITEWKVQKKPW